MSNNTSVLQNYFNQVCDLKLANSKIKNQYDELIKNLKIFFDPEYCHEYGSAYTDEDYAHDRAEFEIEAVIGHKIKK
jgi:CRISPR/Cas system-associated endonuclease Cas3-HD